MKTVFGLIMVSFLWVATASFVSAQDAEVTHNTWTNGAAMPTAVNWPMVGVMKNMIYVVGGYAGGPVVADNQIYNPVTNSWSSGAPIPTATAQGAAAVVKNVLYVFGGSDNGGATVTNASWAYNQKKNTWSSIAAMPTARCSETAVVADNIIYVIGGYNGNRLSTVEAYNPATNTWTEEAGLLLGKSEISAGLFGTAKTGYTIVAADGFSGSDTGNNEGYDVATNTWRSLTSDPNARNGSCFGVIGGKLYNSDGNASGNNPIAVMEAFNLNKNAWTSLAAMPNTVTDSGSAVYKGKLYCIGGGNGAVPPNNTVYGYVQIYQP
ncbi:MAG: kelch repeat-containing protein [Terriglobales bacterium]